MIRSTRDDFSSEVKDLVSLIGSIAIEVKRT
jgi:hypothetical protein